MITFVEKIGYKLCRKSRKRFKKAGDLFMLPKQKNINKTQGGTINIKAIAYLSDESVVEQWSENKYYQYFSGEQFFSANVPCILTELVEFRKRIGTEE